MDKQCNENLFNNIKEYRFLLVDLDIKIIFFVIILYNLLTVIIINDIILIKKNEPIQFKIAILQ